MKIYSQLKSEDIIVAQLSLLAKPRHQLLNAVTLPHTRGYIFLECNMNLHLLCLLRRLPGIVFCREEVVRACIARSEYLMLLNAKPTVDSNFTEGQWVRVTRGVYKGDLGLVDSIHDWGAEVLLIPRIPYCAPDRKGKRKASPISNPAKLFDPTAFKSTSSLPLTQHADGTYAIGHLRFVNGLVLKSLSHRSISATTFGVPGLVLSQFILSEHPSIDIAFMPLPLEWHFMIGERVRVTGTSKIGAIHSTKERQVEIEIDGEGVFAFGWPEVRKVIQTGDHVRVVAGMKQVTKVGPLRYTTIWSKLPRISMSQNWTLNSMCVFLIVYCMCLATNVLL